MNAIFPQAHDIFVEALKVPPADWPEFLDRACGDEPDLRQRLNNLLSAHREAGTIYPPSNDTAATMDQPADCIGSQIGPYKLLEQIGEGGMGLVYMAEQQRPVRRLVALKLIKPGMDSKQIIARFEAERQALAMMDHPNIAKVLDAGATEAGRPYFVMELVRGIPIDDFCNQKRLNIRERLKVFIQVCQAVQHAHQKGIIHRDLKPTNVLVTMLDAVAVPLIIDFGIAKALGPSLTDHTLHTGFAQLVGTPLYMSPEQAEMNQLGVDTRSDIYSLGVMLYELLTGTTPFDKETLSKAGLDEMRRMIREEEPPRPSTRVSTLEAQKLSTVAQHRSTDSRRISATLRGELDWIVMKCLEKDRGRRYESASALGRDIECHLCDEPVQACPPSPTYQLRKFASRHRVWLTTVVMVTVSLLFGSSISIWQAVRATAAEAQAVENESKAKTQEQKATALFEAEATQRKQADENFQVALNAVSRMLSNVNSKELNDVLRIGPLRRQLMQDAVAFYERIAPGPAASSDVRFAMVNMWGRIGNFGKGWSQPDLAIEAFERCIRELEELISNEPKKNEYRARLASYYIDLQSVCMQTRDFDKAETAARRAGEVYAELVRSEPEERSWILLQSQSLNYLATALRHHQKKDEAKGCVARAIDLLETAPGDTHWEHGNLLFVQAELLAEPSDGSADELFRKAISECRQHIMDHPDNKRVEAPYGIPLRWEGMGIRRVFTHHLRKAAVRFSSRHPEEAEKLFDEAAEIWRQICVPSRDVRDDFESFVVVLKSEAYSLRRFNANSPGVDQQRALAHRTKAAALIKEAMAIERHSADRFGVAKSRFSLAQLLEDESRHLLRQVTAEAAAGKPEDVPRMKLDADAYLTEAIQLYRGLAEQFSDDATYTQRLAGALNLQSQHFSKPGTNQQPKAVEQPADAPDGRR